MAELTLAAETGRPTGSRPANRLRGEGRIPGVVYGQGGDSVIVSIDRRDLRLILASETGVNSLIALKVNGKTESAVIKELQRHPVKRNVTHVDFLRVNLNEAIEVEVTLHIVGEAVEVARGGGLVDLATNSITVSAKPNAIPTRIDVDITNLNIGDVVRLADLVLPAGVTAVQDPDTTIVTVELSRTGAAALAAAASGAEGESATPAE